MTPPNVTRVQGSRWTFTDDPVREWVLKWCDGTVLNACAGKTRLGYSGPVIRNDVDPDLPADHHVDVHDLPQIVGADSVETIVFDPPWSGFQASDKYDGGDVNWTRELREGFDTMLKDRGVVVQLGYSASPMPVDLGYQMVDAHVFAPGGRRKAFIGTVARSVGGDA